MAAYFRGRAVIHNTQQRFASPRPVRRHAFKIYDAGFLARLPHKDLPLDFAEGHGVVHHPAGELIFSSFFAHPAVEYFP